MPESGGGGLGDEVRFIVFASGDRLVSAALFLFHIKFKGEQVPFFQLYFSNDRQAMIYEMRE